jgi:hypothetical protein
MVKSNEPHYVVEGQSRKTGKSVSVVTRKLHHAQSVLNSLREGRMKGFNVVMSEKSEKLRTDPCYDDGWWH